MRTGNLISVIDGSVEVFVAIDAFEEDDEVRSSALLPTF
jgi:hypothetical protein